MFVSTYLLGGGGGNTVGLSYHNDFARLPVDFDFALILVSTGPATPPPTTAPAGGVRCGPFAYCFPTLGEVCVGGVRCACKPGFSRRAPGAPCLEVRGIQLP